MQRFHFPGGGLWMNWLGERAGSVCCYFFEGYSWQPITCSADWTIYWQTSLEKGEEVVESQTAINVPKWLQLSTAELGKNLIRHRWFVQLYINELWAENMYYNENKRSREQRLHLSTPVGFSSDLMLAYQPFVISFFTYTLSLSILLQ